MAKTKTVKKWDYRTIQTRELAGYLNGVSAKGDKVFAVYPSGTVAGSMDVLTYHDAEVKVEGSEAAGN